MSWSRKDFDVTDKGAVLIQRQGGNGWATRDEVNRLVTIWRSDQYNQLLFESPTTFMIRTHDSDRVWITIFYEVPD